MSTFLFQLTLYVDGTISYEGKRPKDLPGVLRILADAAEAGGITWVDLDE